MADQTIPEYVTLGEYVSLLKKRGMTKENLFVASIPCNASYNIDCLRSVYCNHKEQWDVVSIYKEGYVFGKSGWKKLRDELFHESALEISSFTDFGAGLDALDSLVKVNENAAVVINGRAIVREKRDQELDTVDLPRISKSKTHNHLELFLSTPIEDNLPPLLQSSTFNVRLSKKLFCDRVNLTIPSLTNDPETRIQYAIDLFGDLNLPGIELFFVGVECFSNMESIKKRWPNHSILPKSLGSDPFMATFVNCYLHESQISIKRCVLTPEQLKKMEPQDTSLFENVRLQIEKESTREQKLESIHKALFKCTASNPGFRFNRYKIVVMLDEESKRGEAKDGDVVLFTMPGTVNRQ